MKKYLVFILFFVFLVYGWGKGVILDKIEASYIHHHQKEKTLDVP
jgi:hypothetical protein